MELEIFILLLALKMMEESMRCVEQLMSSPLQLGGFHTLSTRRVDMDSNMFTSSRIVMFALLAQLADLLPRESPRWWVMRRAARFKEDLTVQDDAKDDYYLTLLRMKRSTFIRLLDALRPYLERQVTRFRRPLHPAHILAYAIHRWASGDCHRHSSWGYGMGKTSGLRAMEDVTAALIVVFPNATTFGSADDRRRSMDWYAEKGFPNCWGCVDCTHIYIDKPPLRNGDHFCSGRTKRFSIVAQIVFDHELRILDLNVGYPGTVHDSRILRNSSMFRRAQAGSVFVDEARHPAISHVQGVSGGYLLGDAGYPALPWLVTPYGRWGRNCRRAAAFDARLKIVRVDSERGNGVLKGRFQNFHWPGKHGIATLPQQFRAVCILHNILIDMGEDVDRVFAMRDQGGGNVHYCPAAVAYRSGGANSDSAAAGRLRDALRDHVCSNENWYRDDAN
ncbi:hypothetical protein CBR_g21231 [Chara braunii]|uniref:DDE Tnp4 domain-containing protein n=1 Tax=Chara braunii TaxID=69332 RepID=A0A388L105_CHABU|nr:hypothetical protein CBR_g21231 [Chara braunii]|eukprot:GBG75990.1 hypothetical protein CBR_g21231 [Chara braunii]